MPYLTSGILRELMQEAADKFGEMFANFFGGQKA